MKKILCKKIHNEINKTMFWNIAVALIVTAILFALSGLCFDLIYCLNDDLMIQSILSGRYSGKASGMAVYLSEPLSALLAFLYGILPKTPWFGIFLAGCYVLCFFLSLYKTLNAFTDKRDLTIKKRSVLTIGICMLCIFVFLGFFLDQYLMPHYTVAAAAVGGSALYIFLISKESRKWKETIRETWIPVLLLLLCYLIRTKVFFMVLPFLAAAGLYRMLKTRSIFNYLLPLLLLGGGIFLFMMLEKFCYRDTAWQEYLEYNDARTMLYDYAGIWDEEDAFRYYKEQGYVPEEIAIYLDYNVLLNENLKADDYRSIASYAELRPDGNRTFSQKIRDSVWLYRHRLLGRTEDTPYNVTVIILYVLAALIFISLKDKTSFGMLIVLGTGRSVLWLYLLAEGRYPERVTVSLYLIELLVLLAWIGNAAKKMMFSDAVSTYKKKDDETDCVGEQKRLRLVMRRIGVCFIGVFIVILSLESGYQLLPAALESSAQQRETNTEEDRLFHYMKAHSENLYLLDVYSVVNHTEYVIKDYDGTYENYLMLGGWAAGSPLVTDKLEAWGYLSAFDALCNGSNVYLVCKDGVGMDPEELKEYYAQRTGEELNLRQIEKIETQKGIYYIYQNQGIGRQ